MGSEFWGRTRRLGGIVAATVATVVVGSLLSAVPASAAEPAAIVKPPTVSADSLPTAQINGIAWDQEIVGDTVYVGGQFTKARPAGAAVGRNEVDRSNMMAYNLQTGVMTSFAPNVNGTINAVEVSPDGTRLYIGGSFTRVNGLVRDRIAAFDTATGQLVANFAPHANQVVRGIAATNSTVYFTGNFTQVLNTDRDRAAAVTRDGVLLPWAPVLDARGNAIEVSPDGSSVVIGGIFTTLNGSSNPGYGLGRVDASTGASLPFGANNVVRNGGTDAAILTLRSDGDSVYGTGFVFGGGGNLEGVFRADWTTGDLVWVEDCHGDTYDAVPIGGVIYAAGHPHYCGSLESGFPQSDPWTFYRAVAFTKEVNRITPYGLNLGYHEFGGNPAPDLLHWFPEFNTGDVSGATQGPWAVTGNDKYVVYGGEFTRVNGAIQQGLARFTVKQDAPKAQGPRGANGSPTLTALGDGRVRVSWPLAWDRDDENLTYRVIRDGVNASPVYETTTRSKSPDWGLPPVTFVDTGLAAGSTHTYRIRTNDADGNVAWGTTASVTVSGDPATASAYSAAVLADSPVSYWPLNETSGPAYDWAGANDLTVASGADRGQTGAMPDATKAIRFSGSSDSFAASALSTRGPQTFALESWFKTTSTRGGKIVGFGNRTTGNSTSYDRHVYLDSSGRVNFGVYPGSSRIATSARSYNDGEWHHVVANLGPTGMELYVDGVRVAQRSDTTSAQDYSGFWRVGGDSTWSGDQYLNGTIDEVAVYGAPLSSEQVRGHFSASGRESSAPALPTDAYGRQVVEKAPTLYWRLSEESGVARDYSGNGDDGVYRGQITRGTEGIAAGDEKAARFQDGSVIGQVSYTNPQIYSLESWIKTTTTSGGKIIGFGNGATGDSSSYDRHVYMRDDGRILFGVYTGAEQTIVSPNALNDGQWHHVVATQSGEGMRLYVDGVLAGTNPTTTAEPSTGFWRVGRDVTWGGSSSRAFNGTIDEVAVYPLALTAAEVASHHSLGATGELPNAAPTAAFTSTVTKMALAVDGSTSVDTDGTIASYDWNWGDGSEHGSGVTAEHVYTEPGDHEVTLTVTDDRGATHAVTKTVTAVANVAPTASFTVSDTGLVVAVDAAASTDPDGTIASYEWNWGDGSPLGEGVSTSHTYAEPGDYEITLTVKDNDGASAEAKESVTVEAPATAIVLAQDTFERQNAQSFGDAQVGGAWTTTAPQTAYSVAGGLAQMTHTRSGSTHSAFLNGVQSPDTVVATDLVLPRPVGGSTYASVVARRVGAEDYRTRVVVGANGAVTLQLQRTNTTLAAVATGLTVSGNDRVRVKIEASGASPTTLKAKVWKLGTPEPEEWRLTFTDDTASLQTAGGVGLVSYTGGPVTSIPYTTGFDNFVAYAPGVEPGTDPGTDPGPQPGNVAPVAAFTSAVTGLQVTTDGAGSHDSDGSVVEYVWNWGDNSPTSTGVNAQHTYAAAGSFTITLTVKDDKGATHSVSAPVTVSSTAQPTPPLANDDFEREVLGGWGAAATGGAWSGLAPAADYNVTGGRATVAVPSGTTRNGYLTSVSSADSSVYTEMSLSALPVSGSVYNSVIARRSGGADYRARVVIGANGAVQLQLQRSGVTLAAVNTGQVLAAGEGLRIRVEAVGTNGTQLRAKVWKASVAEPAEWGLAVEDNTAGLQTAGHPGISNYVAAPVSNGPITVSYTQLRVEASGSVVPVPAG